MTTYAQLPSGIIAPHDLARTVMSEMLFANPGAYRVAGAHSKVSAGWVTSDGSADADTLGDLPTLRRQSRDLIRNDALPAGIVAGNVTAVVGTGVVPQSRIDYEFLGLSEDQADRWQRLAERIFALEAEGNHWDLERRQTFYQQQATVQRAIKESGDVFALRRFKRRQGKKLGVCVQLIEADRVATPSDKSTNDRIRAGVEVDEDGAYVRFHVAQRHPGEGLSLLSSQDFTTVDAFDDNGDPLMLPVIPRLRPGQTRGVPYLAPVVEIFKQLCRYTEAEITAAVVSGMLAVMVTSPGPTGPLASGSTSAIPGMVGGNQITPKGNKITRLQSGMIVDLAPGENIEVVNSTRPNPAFDPFVLAILRQIGSALEVPFEVLVKHFTASYSASRAALMDAWRFFLKERQFLVDSFCQPCWAWVITEAVASGLLAAPGFFEDPLIRQAWLGCDWIGQQAPQIDPVKEAAAAEMWNALGIWSLQDISGMQGKDQERTHRQIVRENKRRQADGLALPLVQETVAAPGQGQPRGRTQLLAQLLRFDE